MTLEALQVRFWWLGAPWRVVGSFVSLGLVMFGMLCALVMMLLSPAGSREPFMIVAFTLGLFGMWYGLSVQMSFMHIARHARSEALSLVPRRAHRLYAAQAFVLLFGLALGTILSLMAGKAIALFVAILLIAMLALAGWGTAQLRPGRTSLPGMAALLPACFPMLMPRLITSPSGWLWCAGAAYVLLLVLFAISWQMVRHPLGARTLSEHFAGFEKLLQSRLSGLLYMPLALMLILPGGNGSIKTSFLPLIFITAGTVPAIWLLQWLASLRSEMRLRWLNGQSRQSLLSFVLYRLARHMLLNWLALATVLLSLWALDQVSSELSMLLLWMMPCILFVMLSGTLAELSFRPPEDQRKVGRLVAYIYVLPGALIGVAQMVAFKSAPETIVTTFMGFSLLMGSLFAVYVRRCWHRIEL